MVVAREAVDRLQLAQAMAAAAEPAPAPAQPAPVRDQPTPVPEQPAPVPEQEPAQAATEPVPTTGMGAALQMLRTEDSIEAALHEL